MKYILAAAFALLASPALAGIIIIDIQLTPEVTVREPVAAVAPTPGAGSVPDTYKAPKGPSVDPALASNQCWFNRAKTRKTAGTQDAAGYCVVQGSLASMGHGGLPGRARITGLYSSWWAGLETPILDFTDDHDLIHEHIREE